jgi:LPXTG-motif cell wall-anchored protein
MRITSETVRHLVRAAGAFTVAASAIVLLVNGTSTASKGEAHGDCEQAKIASSEVQHSISDRRYLTVTSVGDQVVDAVVVNGAGTSYTYRASELGDLPWTRLHAPDHGNITTWYACGASPKGTPPETTTTTTTTPCTTTTTTSDTTTTTSGSTTTTSSGSTTTTTTTGSTTTGSTTTGSTTTGSTTTGSTTPTTGDSTPNTTPTTTATTRRPVFAGDSDKLASTGFSSMWLVFLGLGLLVVGGVFVASPKLRGLFRR